MNLVCFCSAVCECVCVCVCVAVSVAVVVVQASTPPTIEATTTPRITQHIIIIIFFCTVSTTDKQSSKAANGGGQRKTCQKYHLYFTQTHHDICNHQNKMQFRRKADDSNAVGEEILMCLIMSLECNCDLKTFPHAVL